MRGIDLFRLFYNEEEFEKKFVNSSEAIIPIPTHLCAHPRNDYLPEIIECKVVDFVRPYKNIQTLICICIPTITEPSIAHSNEDLQKIHDEYIYLPLQELNICPIITEQSKCQHRAKNEFIMKLNEKR